MSRVYGSPNESASPIAGGRVYATPTTAPPQEGFFKSLAKGIASPFLRTAATVGKTVGTIGGLAVAGGAKLIGADEKAKEVYDRTTRAAAAPVKVPFFGDIKPVGGTGSLVGDVKDAGGVGLELGTYPLGGGATMATGRNIFRQSVGTTLKQSAKIGSATGGAGALGMSLQEQANSTAPVAEQVKQASLDTVFGAGVGAAFGLGAGAVAEGAALAANLFKPSARFANQARTRLVEQYSNDLNLTKRQNTLESRWERNTPEFLAEESIYNPNVRLEAGPNGTLDTSKAVGELRKVSQVENEAFREILAAEQKLVSLEDYRRAALSAIDTSQNRAKGSEYDSMLAHVNKEVDALKKNYADRQGAILENGDVKLPLDVFNEVKQGRWATTKGFGTVSDSIYNSTNFQMGHVAKEMIEASLESADARAINKRLGDLASAIKILDDRQGAKLPGGRLGRYTAFQVGAIIGLPQGTAGSVVGALTAEKLAEIVQSPEISNGVKRWVITRVRTTPAYRTVAEQAEKILKRKLEEASARKALPAPRFIAPPPPEKAGSTPGYPNYNPPGLFGK